MNEHSGALDGEGRRFAIVVSRYNQMITERLLEGATECLVAHGADEDSIDVYRVPGAWELPQVAARILARNAHDALIALGCVIRGETPHFEYVAGEAAAGLGEIARNGSTPVVFGVLTTDNVEQALERAGSKSGNKGWEAALGALELADLFASME